MYRQKVKRKELKKNIFYCHLESHRRKEQVRIKTSRIRNTVRQEGKGWGRRVLGEGPGGGEPWCYNLIVKIFSLLKE
jgi:hypothetical protein